MQFNVLLLGKDTKQTEVYATLVRDMVECHIDVMSQVENAANWLSRVRYHLVVIDLPNPTAFVERDAVVAEAAVICAGAILGAGCRLGANTLVNTGAIVDHECAVGDHAHLGPGCRLAGRVTVGALTFVGLGATVREGIRIGENVVVGMGSVVVADIPDNAVAYGVPSRVRAAPERSDA